MGFSKDFSDQVQMYRENGFAIARVFTQDEVEQLEEFSRAWIYRLLSKWTDGQAEKYPLETYHIWSKSLKVDHGEIFRAKNRYAYPDEHIEQILANDRIKDFLAGIGIARFEKWDDGIGWLGFRFIRPGAGDGYPFTCKAWGVAKHVISIWIPVIGYSSKETLTMLPGSHLREYKKYLPENQKFRKDEYRLAQAPKETEVYQPNLEKGQVLFYHPRLIHSEDVRSGDVTRLNLEMRFNPLVKG